MPMTASSTQVSSSSLSTIGIAIHAASPLLVWPPFWEPDQLKARGGVMAWFQVVGASALIGFYNKSQSVGYAVFYN